MNKRNVVLHAFRNADRNSWDIGRLHEHAHALAVASIDYRTVYVFCVPRHTVPSPPHLLEAQNSACLLSKTSFSLFDPTCKFFLSNCSFLPRFDPFSCWPHSFNLDRHVTSSGATHTAPPISQRTQGSQPLQAPLTTSSEKRAFERREKKPKLASAKITQSEEARVERKRDARVGAAAAATTGSAAARQLGVGVEGKIWKMKTSQRVTGAGLWIPRSPFLRDRRREPTNTKRTPPLRKRSSAT